MDVYGLEWKLSENSPMFPPRATVLLRTVQLMRVKRARCVIADYFSEQWMEVKVFTLKLAKVEVKT